MKKLTFLIISLFLFMIFSSNVSANAISVGTYESSLPVLYISTENNSKITKNTYVAATMTLQGNEQYNSTNYLYEGAIDIKGRGNMTWQCSNKKPYHFKLEESSNLLNLGKGKHWVLLANYFDESLLRNKLGSDLALSLGLDAMDSTWVELILNGKYVGNYQLCEQVRIATNRINITNWKEYAEDFAKEVYYDKKETGFSKADRNAFEDLLVQDLSWITSGSAIYNDHIYSIKDYDIQLPSLNGGFLLEIDHYYDGTSKFRTEKDYPINVKSPDYLSTNKELINYTKNYISLFEKSVFSPTHNTTYNQHTYHYSQLVDLNSLVNFWLVTEVMFNADSGWKSTYLYKDVGEIMKFGPAWDFDLSSGHSACAFYSYNNWWSKLDNAYYFNQIINDPYFLTRIREAYWKNHLLFTDLTTKNGAIEKYNNYLSSSAATNSAIWLWDCGYSAEKDNLLTWLQNRLTWMDQQMDNQNSLLNSISTFKPSNKLQLTVKNEKNQTYPTDNRPVKVNADYDVTSNNNIQLDVSISDKNITHYNILINGIDYYTIPVLATNMNINIPRTSLCAKKDELNVIAVYGKNADNKVIHSNFVTLYDYTPKVICYEIESDGKIKTKYALIPSSTPNITPTPLPSMSCQPSNSPVPTDSIIPKNTFIPETTPTVDFSSTEEKFSSSEEPIIKKSKFCKNGLIYEITATANKNTGKVKLIGIVTKNKQHIILPKYVTFQKKKYHIVAISNKCFCSNEKLCKITLKTTTLKRIGKTIFSTATKKIIIRVPKKKKRYYKKLFSAYPKIVLY